MRNRLDRLAVVVAGLVIAISVASVFSIAGVAGRLAPGPIVAVHAEGAPADATVQVLIGDYAVARGTITLDGSNPSSATTGLTAITSCALTDKRSTAPALDPQMVTSITTAVAGRLDVYAWKATASGDATLIASTDADDLIDYICLGTK